MRWIGLFGLAATVAACSTVPEGDVQFTREVEVEYSRFAACAFRKLDEVWPSEVKLVDLRGENAIRIAWEGITYGALGVIPIRQMEAYVRKIGESRSRVEIRTRSGSWPEQTWSKIESCGRNA